MSCATKLVYGMVCADMFIETTFMRYGHGPGGLIGITLKPSVLNRWALSLHICSRLIKDLAGQANHLFKLIFTRQPEKSDARIGEHS